MKIVIDGVGVKSGGGATVMPATLQAACAHERIREIVLAVSPASVREFALPAHPKLRVVDIPAAESAWGRYGWATRGLDRFVVRQGGADAVLCLPGMSRVRRDFASFITVEQALPYSPEALRRCSFPMRARMAMIGRLTRRAARACDHIFVQTEVMRESLSRAFRIPLNRFSVLMPSARALAPPSSPSRKLEALFAEIPQGALLYVGSGAPHKNLSVVAEGLRLLPESSRPRWFVTLPAESAICRDGAVGLGTLDEGELYQAYRQSTILVMPSLIETVGLPMLEAMRVGTPVLAADRPYAHAVCGDAAEYFDPLSPADFAEKAARLLADAALRAELSARGAAVLRRLDAVDAYRAKFEIIVDLADAKKRGKRLP